jgi:2-iminobutanoate/2-iminopropanoate deaminase
MDKNVIDTSLAPAAIGPYVQANRVGDFIFTSGQLPLDPETGEFPAGGVAAQTAQSLENLSAILEAAGSSLGNVIKTTVFLNDINDFAEMNGVYSDFFNGGSLPDRSAVAVEALPKGALVEIEAIALARD